MKALHLTQSAQNTATQQRVKRFITDLAKRNSSKMPICQFKNSKILVPSGAYYFWYETLRANFSNLIERAA